MISFMFTWQFVRSGAGQRRGTAWALLTALAMLIGCLPNRAGADDIDWAGPSGTWSPASHWIGGVAPTPLDTAIINSNAVVQLDVNAAVWSVHLNQATFNISGNSFNVLAPTNGMMLPFASPSMAPTVVNQTGGNVLGGDLQIQANGTYNLVGGALNFNNVGIGNILPYSGPSTWPNAALIQVGGTNQGTIGIGLATPGLYDLEIGTVSAQGIGVYTYGTLACTSGTITATGNPANSNRALDFWDDSIFEVQIAGQYRGSGFTEIDVTAGDVHIAAGALFHVDLAYAPAPNQTFTIIDNQTSNPIAGTFAGLPQGALLAAVYGGQTYEFTVDYTGGTGNDLVLTHVPEPGCLILLGIGSISLLIRRRRCA
jgi:hypothetical protein